MSPPLLIALILGAFALAVGYVGMAVYGESRPVRAARSYWGLVLPGAFTALLAGIWGLHRHPALLTDGVVRGMLVGISLLIIIDAACFRTLNGDFARSRRTRALIPAAGAFILGGVVLMGLTRLGSG